jgi:methylenetetrahydrofolate dehydrogenase (NADP+)/methenyltetrahydrofolate cyclohydrolase
MVIDGKQLAQSLLTDLKQDILKLKHPPTLAVIQVGNDIGSTAYIQQKKKKGEEVGINVIHKHFPESITQEQLIDEIEQLNSDTQITGIIIQRPLPKHLSTTQINQQVAREKDVDGFRPDSSFTPPVALGVLYLLRSIKLEIPDLKNKKIVILGRGETAGHPIAQTLTKLKVPFEILHSQSTIENPLKTIQTLQSADIIISCVGKRVVKKEDLKPGVILVGVGISRGFKGLQGDYDEDEIRDIASFYTPTPGGVGPLTVAFLLSNVIN